MNVKTDLLIDADLAQKAFREALRRYPEAHGALVFLWVASGLAAREPSPEHLAWARTIIEARHPTTGEA